MRYLNGAPDWLENKLAHDRQLSGLEYLQIQPDQPGFGLPEGARRFAMVRNPYDRTLSAYLNKVEQRLPLKAEDTGNYWDSVVAKVENFRVNELDTTKHPEISLEVFLRWIKYSDDWEIQDEHWCPQTTLLRQPEIEFDYIGRFENIAEDAPKILAQMGCDQSFPSQRDVKFAPTNASVRLERYMTPEVEALIESIYALDFEQFGYPSRSGHDMALRTEIAHLQRRLIRHKNTHFASVANGWDEELFVRNHFDPVERIQPQEFKSYIKSHCLLEQVLKSLKQRTGASVVNVLDIGAYMGQFAVGTYLASQLSHVEIRLSCAEANPRISKNLCATLDLYGAEAEVISAAISHQNGQARFAFRPHRMLGGRIADSFGPNPPDDLLEEVVDCLDLRKVVANETAPALIKLDIGGLELNSLRILSQLGAWPEFMFIANLRPWQLDREIDGQAFGSWLTQRFRVIATGSPLVPKAQTLTKAGHLLKIDGESQWFILDPLSIPGSLLETLPA